MKVATEHLEKPGIFKTKKTIRDSIYEQKRSTQHQIVALCPFHMGISVNKQTIAWTGYIFLLLG